MWKMGEILAGEKSCRQQECLTYLKVTGILWMYMKRTSCAHNQLIIHVTPHAVILIAHFPVKPNAKCVFYER